MPKRLLAVLLAVTAVAVAVLTAVNTVLLVEIRDDADAAADAIIGRDGTVAKGVWVAVHSNRPPASIDGRIHHSASGDPIAIAEPAPPTTTASAVTTTVQRSTTTASAVTTTVQRSTTTASAVTTTVQRTTTTRPPTTTTTASRMVIEDFYLASDGETYFVEVSGVLGATYCEAHLVGTDGRRTGEWSNELLTGSQDTVIISLWDYDRTARVDGVEVECTS